MPASLVALPPTVLTALLEGDLPRARELSGLPLPEFFLSEGWLWRMRLADVQRDPSAAAWVVRALVVDDEVVGHAGFHGPPDDDGAVEVGYTVVPEQRGRGLGHTAMHALLGRAAASGQVRFVRASVSPDNAPSLTVVRRAGFRQVGEQVDEEDGLELVFELAVPTG